eukprot:4629593-Pleurochrysis_carterae.AAC.1
MLGHRLLGLREPANSTLICHASRVNFGPACDFASSLSYHTTPHAVNSILAGVRHLAEYDAAIHDFVYLTACDAPSTFV